MEAKNQESVDDWFLPFLTVTIACSTTPPTFFPTTSGLVHTAVYQLG